MYNLAITDILLITKIFACVMGDKSITLTELDMEAAKMLIKKLADQRYDWTSEQREQFKMFVDMVLGIEKRVKETA